MAAMASRSGHRRQPARGRQLQLAAARRRRGGGERGATAEYFYPSRMDVAGCRPATAAGAGRTPAACSRTTCSRVYAALKACDVVVLASPVYFYALSSWAKAVLDRCYALITPGAADTGGEEWPLRVPPGKGFYFISTQAEESPLYGYQILPGWCTGSRGRHRPARAASSPRGSTARTTGRPARTSSRPRASSSRSRSGLPRLRPRAEGRRCARTRSRPRGGAAASEDFLRRFPAYAATAAIDDLRAADYARLDRLGHTYLDYTGGGLYAESQLRRHHELLARAACSATRTRRARRRSPSAELASEARDAVRRFFNAPEDEFEIVFTRQRQRRAQAGRRGVPVRARRRLPPQLRQPQLGERHPRVRRAQGRRRLLHPGARGGPAARRGASGRARRRRGAGAGGAAKLFAYPAQSNFSGVQHPLEWVAEAQELGWDVVLDCAAFAPTNALDAHGDRRRLRPDLLLQALRLPDRQSAA